MIQKVQRLKQDDLTTAQGRGGGAEREQEDNSATTDEIQVSNYEVDTKLVKVHLTPNTISTKM